MDREDKKLEEAKAECVRMKAMIVSEAKLHKQATGEQIKQNHADIDQMQKEISEHNQKSHLAQERIWEAGGSAPLPSAMPGVTLIPVADGNIVHSNSIVPSEMAQAILDCPRLAQMGIQSEAAGALTEFVLTYVNSKSLKVGASQQQQQQQQQQQMNSNQPSSSKQAPTATEAGATQGATPGQQQQQQQQMDEDDPDTEDDISGEEAVLFELNNKKGEKPPKKKMKKSEKKAKKEAKKGKMAEGATAAGIKVIV